VYKHSVEVKVPDMYPFQLHDASLEKVDWVQGKLQFRLNYKTFTALLQLNIQGTRLELTSSTDLSLITVTRKAETYPLMTYLKDFSLHIYLSDFSRISGVALFRSNFHTDTPFSTDCIRTEDWKAQNVDITKEFSADGTNDNSIHGFLKHSLPPGADEIVIYDHGSGEIGDFVTVQETTNEIQFGLYHCKGSGGTDVGQRVGDVYEVAGQVVKSLIWLRKPHDLLEKIKSRLDQGSLFLKGDRTALRSLFVKAQAKSFQFSIYCVQPGLSASNLADKLTGPMAAARDYVARSCRGKVIFLISP
jgi:hypothetical protein